MKQTAFKFLIIIAGLLLITTCRREDFSYTNSVIKEKTFTGYLSMPDGSTTAPETIKIISTSDETSVGNDGKFDIPAPDGYLSFFFAEDPEGKTIGMSYQDPSKGIIINDSSTTVAIVMSFPVNWGRYGLTQSQLLQEIKGSLLFKQMLSYVKNLMLNMPGELMNYEKHPSVLNTAADLIMEIINAHGGINKNLSNFYPGITKNYENKTLIDGWGPRVSDISGNPEIEIVNPTGTPYGIASFNLNKDSKIADSYGMWKTPFYVDSWGLNWWIIDEEGRTNFDLGDGSWVLMLSRIDPWYLSGLNSVFALKDLVTAKLAVDQGDYLNALRSNARSKALVGTMINITARTLGIVSVIDPTEATGFIEIALDYGPSSADLLADITLGGADPISRGKEDVLKWVLDIIEKNDQLIINWAKKHGVKLASKALQKSIENLTVILDCVSAGGDIAQLMSLLVDSYIAEQDVVYTIVQKNGNAVITESKPPSAPSVTGISNCNKDQVYSYQVVSLDPENDQIKYHISFGDGTDGESPMISSGTSYTFNHVWGTGTYEINAYAVDIKGATSANSLPLRVKSSPAGDFIETFENYNYGYYKDDNTWWVGFEEPSKILISNVAYEGNKSAKFIDYDPAIGDQTAKYASLYTYLDNNIETFESMFRVENPEDAFGFRGWDILGDFSTIAYYVIIDNGYLKWVKGAFDLNDPNDFIPITQVNQGIWYKISISVNWATSTYEIYLNNALVKSGADFVSKERGLTISKAPYLQFVAFTNTNCRSAYIDNIYIKGAKAINPNLNSTKSKHNELFKKSADLVGR